MQPIGWLRFEANPDLLLLIDQIARRYNMRPHEVLELDSWQISLAVACVRQNQATSAQLVSRINSQGGMVFPTVQVG